MRSIEQRLAQEHFGKLVAGTSTAKDVRELLGPPVRVVRMERLEREVWDYPYLHYSDFRIHWVQFSYDGVVREQLDMIDWSMYPQSGPRRRR
jgi:hypothetical protein